MLLECTAQALASIRDTHQRRQLTQLVDQIWRHLERRRIMDGPGKAYRANPQVPSRFGRIPRAAVMVYAFRVVESLISTVYAMGGARVEASRWRT